MAYVESEPLNLRYLANDWRFPTYINKITMSRFLYEAKLRKEKSIIAKRTTKTGVEKF